MKLIDAEPLEEILRARCAQCSNDYGSIAGAISGCLKLVQVQPVIAPPPNPPLTLEELREMDGKGVWCGDYQCDGIISVEGYGRWADVPFLICRITGVNCTYNIVDHELTIYRRKPEEATT